MSATGPMHHGHPVGSGRRRSGLRPLVVAILLLTGMPASIRAGVPDGVSERVVMADGVIDGRAVSIVGLSASIDPKSVLERYRRAWSREGTDVIGPMDQGSWRVLSRRLPDGFETVQWRARRDGGAEGFRTTWPDASPGASDVPLPRLPDGFTRKRLMSARDAGQRSVTLLAIGDVPTGSAWARWTRSLEMDGWSSIAPASAPATPRTAPSPRWFRKGDAVAALDVSASAGGSTALLVVERRR